MSFDPGNRLIAALDLPSRAEADALVTRLGGVPSWLKIGLELFCAAGPSLVRDYVAAGHRIMLDLKLHDIPETVGRAVARLADLGVGLITVHAGGGRAMLAAAVEAAKANHATRILAVTVLTSLDDADLREVGAVGPAPDLVLRRTHLAAGAGCGGVVASPLEASVVRAAVPPAFLVVTPGIRATGAATGDQKRVMTPAAARAAGADLIVVGRPLRDAADPAQAARDIVAQLAAAEAG